MLHIIVKKETNLVVAICPAAAREQTVCGRWITVVVIELLCGHWNDCLFWTMLTKHTHTHKKRPLFSKSFCAQPRGFLDACNTFRKMLIPTRFGLRFVPFHRRGVKICQNRTSNLTRKFSYRLKEKKPNFLLCLVWLPQYFPKKRSWKNVAVN